MNIHEYQAKELFEKFGVPSPNGMVASTAEEAEALIMRGCHITASGSYVQTLYHAPQTIRTQLAEASCVAPPIKVFCDDRIPLPTRRLRHGLDPHPGRVHR